MLKGTTTKNQIPAKSAHAKMAYLCHCMCAFRISPEITLPNHEIYEGEHAGQKLLIKIIFNYLLVL